MTGEPMTADADDVARKKAAAPGLKLPPPGNGMTSRRRLRNRLAAVFFNAIITHIPSHTIRQGYLRAFGAHIGQKTAIMRGTQVFDIEFLTIGSETAVGWRCLLDGRGGLYIGDNVTIASDVHILGGTRDINHRDFALVPIPTVIEDYAWIASRAMILPSHIKRGAVIAGQAFVMADIGECEVVGGNPAKVISKRDPDALQYSAGYRPLFS
ncbi:acyltransferase [Mycobacterium deserti]|uniref:Acyltransferase n=1 Tax=Mycobacterium deserti TaxID=2978347 RepID=A0ABT2MF15_9MYCO|nr:acyltransferase [Mycobacterium deserti]MCT7660874.1 acyltransferase [Mycobacterium deserti]